MTNKQLSPASQAIWDAWNDAYEAQGPLEDMGHPIAAALRAAADEVMPENLRGPHGTGFRLGAWAGKQEARREFLAIAAELEGK